MDKRIKFLEAVVFLFVLLIFALLINKYSIAVKPSNSLKLLRRIEKATIYSDVNKGSVANADSDINNDYIVARYEPVHIENITWTEDPYNEKYWRFNFYNLQISRDLIFAYRSTGKKKYLKKLIELSESFIDNGMDKIHSWDDFHAVAFRTMNLVNIWAELKSQGNLSSKLAKKFQEALRIHGYFLQERKHYESLQNHGVNEAAALLLLAENFKNLPESKLWMETAIVRIRDGLETLVDSDGVLVENSPYYEFYVLEKYWQINTYAKKNNINLSSEFDAKIKKMTNYCTYILRPDSTIPEISASLKRRISNNGVYKEIAEEHPELKYVLTQGQEGTEPSLNSVEHPTAGQTIMRSGWEKGEKFLNQTQLIFNVGSYRTTHSHFDQLSFTLFGSGIPLLIDSGLYTYDHNELRNYFYGTSAHNTVVVDNKDQLPGSTTIGQSYQGQDYYYQSAESELYPGVKHNRAILMIGKNAVIIIDSLTSDQVHTYTQKFHVSPELKTKISGLSLTASKGKDVKLSIEQIRPENIEISSARGRMEPLDGLCSFEYGKYVPCDAISYTQAGKTAEFITLLNISPEKQPVTARFCGDSDSLKVSIGLKIYDIGIHMTKPVERKVTVLDSKENSDVNTKQTVNISGGWKYSLTGCNVGIERDPGEEKIRVLRISMPENAERVNLKKCVDLDLSDKNLVFKIKCNNKMAINEIKLELSSNKWKSYAVLPLKYVYRDEYENEWLNITLGKSRLSNTFGAWEIAGDFDWRHIDGVGLTVTKDKGSPSIVSVGSMSLQSGQNEGRLVFVFDDGAVSVLSAADLMKQYGVKGCVAVTANYIKQYKRGNLSLADLKRLDNNSGWDILNHSCLHKNALTEYYATNNMKGLEDDILDGIDFLSKNGINSNQNWYIYPHGATNLAIKNVVAKYYKFARTLQTAPEVFPFGDNYGVKQIEINRDTKPDDVIRAMKDAQTYNQTLILTLHRIQTSNEETEGKDPKTIANIYDINNLKRILDGVEETGIKTVTFSELDKENGIPELKVKIRNAKPSQIELKISAGTRYPYIRDKAWAVILFILFVPLLFATLSATYIKRQT